MSRSPVPPEFRLILETLHGAEVRFIVVGGLAGLLHGLGRATYDVDVVYARDEENVARLVDALAPHQPYLRGAPPGLPFDWSRKTVRNGLNFTLETKLGDLDLLGEIVGGGTYEELLPHCEVDEDILEFPILLVSLRKLLELKRAAGRPKDFELIGQIECLMEELEAQKQEDGSRTDLEQEGPQT